MKEKIKFLIFIPFLLMAQNSEMQDNFISGTIKAQQNQTKIYSDDTQEVIYEHIKTAINENTQVQRASFAKIYYTPKINKKQNNNYKKNQHFTKFYLNGYCQLPYQVQVDKLTQFVSLKCNFDKGEGKLTIMLVPDVYSEALVAKPLYVVLNNKKYFVKGGIVMNAQKTSINLASVINDRKIEKFLAQTGISSANIITKQAEAYLQAKQQSETQNTVIYPDGNTSNPVVVSNTQPPHIKDYIQNTGIQILSNIINNVSDSFFINLPYLFKINKNTIFYTELFVTDEYEGLPLLKINSNSLEIDNPKKKKILNINGGFEKRK